MARPKKYTKKYLSELVDSFEDYIATTPIPIIKEWCSMSGVPSKHIYDHEEFADPLKRCTDKKEANLERYALDGKVDKTMAIFSLKQLGWRDKQEVTGADGDPITIKVVNA